jgi:hypothetical protein
MWELKTRSAMNSRKIFLATLMLALSLACAGARAQQDAPKPAPDAQQERTQAPAEPAQQPANPRRSVQQVIEPTPRIGAATPSYGPTLTARPPPAALSGPPPSPVRINGCDAGGCNDTSGQRYNGGVGNTLLGPQGQLCTKGVAGAQCF